MTRRDTTITLRQMLDFAREVRELAQGRSRRDLDHDRLFELGVIKLVEMVGEAANRIPLEERSQYPDVEWSQIIGMRNRLIHGYDVVDLDVVWAVVAEEIPPLAMVLEKILTEKGII